MSDLVRDEDGAILGIDWLAIVTDIASRPIPPLPEDAA